jgi:hypothetical protein
MSGQSLLLEKYKPRRLLKKGPENMAKTSKDIWSW